MKFDLRPHLLEPFEFRALAQAGPFHFLIGFHNPFVELQPSWAYVSTPFELLPVPLPAQLEMFGPQSRWGPVCSYAMAADTVRQFRSWVYEQFEAYADEVELFELDSDVFAQWVCNQTETLC